MVPFNLSQDWNLIVRWIVPIIYQPLGVSEPPPPSGPDFAFSANATAAAAPTNQGVYGFGDMQPAFFFSPKKGKVIWGVGPQFLLPTATRTGILGQGKFGIGPTAVLLVQPGKWTVGLRINNVWSVAGHSNLPDVNQFLLQYFINYNLPKGYYLTWQPTITGHERGSMGSALGRWHRSHHEVRSAAGQCRTSILWQRCSSAQRIALEHAAANRIPVPQKAELTVRNSEHGQTVQSATTTAG